jgi:pantetheine-phosphate adenylyltransferase
MAMRRAVCSGSFDPVTKGHLDIIERASRMFDEIIVCVFFNPTKDKALFTPEERVAMLKTATAHLPNVKVTSYSGLLNDFCVAQKAPFIVRGLRAFTDFEYEFQRALLLKKMNEHLETVFIMTKAEYSYISSSGVREILTFDGDINMLVPKGVGKQIRGFLKEKNWEPCD